MDGRKNSLGQLMVVAAAALVLAAGGGVTRGEAMAKASIDQAEPAGAAGPQTSVVSPHADELPPAFQLSSVASHPPTVTTAASDVGVRAPSPSPTRESVAMSPDTHTTDGTMSHAESAALPTKDGTSAKASTAPAAVAAPSEIESRSIRDEGSAPFKAANIEVAGKVVSTGGTSGMMNALQVGTALVVVIGLIFIGKALAKKFVPGAKASNGKGVIEILARYPLCKNQSLVLVRIGSQIVTLNQCKDSSQSVLVVSDPTEVAKLMGQIDGQSPTSIQAGFTKLLANARMDLEDPNNDPDRNDFELRSMEPENLDNQLEEMASAKRQLMQLRQQVRSVRDSLPRS